MKILTRIGLFFLLLIISIVIISLITFTVDLCDYALSFKPYPSGEGLLEPKWLSPVMIAAIAGCAMSCIGGLALIISAVIRCVSPRRHVMVQIIASVALGLLAGLCWKISWYLEKLLFTDTTPQGLQEAILSIFMFNLVIGIIFTTILASVIIYVERKQNRPLRETSMLIAKILGVLALILLMLEGLAAFIIKVFCIK
jgi:hypothetical protein